jgi:leader peptidase (prepilin peptidase)/N-methyltransferase
VSLSSPGPWLLAAFGLAFGSFLNVVIYRLPRRQSLAWPGSYCPECRTPIRWYDNLPVFGWLMLGGRCRSCRTPIGIRYPIVEAVTGALFVIHGLVFGWDAILVPRLLFACAMVALFAIDLEHKLLPDAITLPGMVVGVVFSLFFPPGLFNSVLGVLLGYGSLWFIATAWKLVRSQQAMGGGDLKMLGMVGAYLGWKGVVVTFLLSFLIGGFVAGLLLAIRRVRLASEIPFGTFLAAAAVFASLWGERLLNWYLSFFRM